MKRVKFVAGKVKILYGGTTFGSEERKAINKTIDKNWWGADKETQKFEHELAQTLGIKHAVFVNSGSSALELGIRAADLEKGSEVIVPAVTFPTPVASIIREGLIPVVCDVEEGSNFIDPESFEKSISEKTKAVLVVYVAGNIGNLDEIIKIARKHNLLIFEDNCDGFGGSWKGKMLGTFGTFSAISTHAAHIISTGQGGAVFTNKKHFADKLISLRDWGRISNFSDQKQFFPDIPIEYHRYIYDNLGSNYNALELQAAMGSVQLKRLFEFKKLRQRNFNILYKNLLPLKDNLFLPKINPDSDPCWYTFTLLLKKNQRKALISVLEKANIEWRPILTGNIARQPIFKNHVIVRSPLPNADAVFERGFWVSVHPKWPKEAMEYISKTITDFLNA